MSGGGSFSSDQTTLTMAVIGADTLARAGRARITSIQAKGIASSILKFMMQQLQEQLEQVI